MQRLNRAILEKIVTLSREAVLVADARRSGMPILFVNPALAGLVDVEPDDVKGQVWDFFLDTQACAEQLQQLTESIACGSNCQAVLPARRSGREFQLNAVPLAGRQGKPRYLLVQVAPLGEPVVADAEVKVDLLERELDRAREANRQLGRRDPDTGLLRYSYFLELSERDFALCSRERRELAVLTFTIREFEVYLQTFGDKAAQSCLRMVGGRIAGALRRAGDLCARIDDASFVALITGHDREQAQDFADQIAQEVRRLALHHPRASGPVTRGSARSAGGIAAKVQSA